jgi:hypothetical protein
MDQRLAYVYDGASRNPLGYGKPRGLKTIHLARTRQILTPELEFIPAYRVWLRPDIAQHTVTLLYVELCPAEDMDIG